MGQKLTIKYLSPFFIAAFFVVFFLYFFLLNPYHLIYLEQKQLFIYSWHFFTEFLSGTGGLSDYAGEFLTQFFISPVYGPIILTFMGIAVYFLSSFILGKFSIKGILWSLLPLLFLAGLQSDHQYKTGYTTGFLFSLVYLAFYLSLPGKNQRYLTGFAGWAALYMISGVFSFPAMLISILYELFFSGDKKRFIIIAGYVLTAVLFPFFLWKTVFIQSLPDTWLRPVLSLNNTVTKLTLYGLLSYFPLVMIILLFISRLRESGSLIFKWNWKNLLAGTVLILGFSVLIRKYSYDPRMELLLKIDQSLQRSEWDKALELCSEYPETHRMIIYFSNIALLKSGQMGDKMFHYKQVGPDGLSLPWTANDFIPFFGNDIFYHLGYINEAYHWTFEAIVSNGNCPRLVKRIVMTSLIQGNYGVAEKYLMLLNNTLFYRGWAGRYLGMLGDPGKIGKDKEINEKRKLIIHTDFFAGDDDSELSLNRLMENQSANRMVFEYFMASLLLKKDIITFVSYLERLKDYGFESLPVHYEEALIWYMGYSKKDAVPEGYQIREATIKRFMNYADAYASYTGSPEDMTKAFKKHFGTSYWYYYHFVSYEKAIL